MNPINFRTEIFPEASAFKISTSGKIFTIGSCFADVIGERFQKNKFEVLKNPFGIIFNPVSISKILKKINENDLNNYQKNDIDKTLFLERDERFYHYDFHSDFNAETQAALQALIEIKIKETFDFVKQADVIIITLGTSFVYKHFESGEYVANCHKMPSDLFEKDLLDLFQINVALENIIENVKKINRHGHIIFTLSPVRHIKDSLVLNQVSKSLLRVACHHIVEKYHAFTSYFPSYEIMLDDLRDYRFYKPDLIHPSEVAEDYIWNKFTDVYFDEKAKAFLNKWDEIIKLIGHRFFQTGNEKYFTFVKKTLDKLYNVRELVNVEMEIAEWEKKLNS